MAGERDTAILSRLDDMSSRLASDKAIKDLSETFKSLLHEVLTKVDTQASQIKRLENLIIEGHEANRKDVKKLREELEEKEIGGGGEPPDDSEPPKWVAELLGQAKALGKHVLGDDATVETIRGAVRGAIGKFGKAAKKGLGAAASDDE